MPLIVGSRHVAAVLSWKPFAAAAVATATWLALTDPPSPLLLSSSAAAVAATTPFVLDDPGAATLQSSPTTLLRRRGHRVALVLPLVGSWWALAVTIVSRSTAHLPLAAHTLQLITLVAIGLAGASTTSRFGGDSSPGGTTGAIVVIVCFGTAFLPARSLQLVPADPTAPGAARQLVAILAVAVAIQLGASADPARRMTPLRRARV